MRIELTLEAILQEYATENPLIVELNEKATVGDILKTLHIPSEEVMIAFVDHKEANLETSLHEGAKVDLCPFICGG